jgi:hypothetical protein
MSHFFTAVILPANTPASMIEERVSDLLAPYDENEEVEPYQKACYCIGSEAREDARVQADLAIGTINSLRESFRPVQDALKAQGFDQFSEEAENAWRKHVAEYNRIEEEAFATHPLKNAAIATCEDCHGTGTCESTYNPLSKWDWYSIGGRWDGDVIGDPQRDERGFNFPDEYRQLGHNLSRAGVLLELVKTDPENAPFAIVGPDGTWLEKGKMGWFGVVSGRKDKDEWTETVISALEAAPDAIVVGCDLHI